MNKYFLLLIAVLFTVSCKNGTEPVPSYVGKWKLVSQSGGFAGKTFIPSPDSTYLLSINANKSYERMINTRLTQTGTYDIGVKTSTAFNSSGQAIIYDNANWEFIVIKNDTLVLTDPFPDGFGSAYVKVK